MTIEIKINNLPESVSEAVIAAWHREPGEHIARGDNLVDLETDKVVLEIPAPEEGTLVKILKPEGEKVFADDVIALFEPGATAAAPTPGEPSAAVPSPLPSPHPPLSPAVRKLVAEHRLDPAAISGSGRGGRILKEDVLRHLEALAAPSLAPPPTPVQTPTAPAAAAERPRPQAVSAPPAPAGGQASRREEPAATAGTGGRRAIRRVPMSPVRARIAERLLQSSQQTAMLTTFNEIDMSAVKRLRSEHGERFQQRHGVRLGFMSFFVAAVTEALKRFPIVNAAVDGDDILYHDFYDVGIAVGSSRGLVVPVLRDTDLLGFADIERAIADFGARAGEGKLAMEELSGGTFTITNGGVFGSLLSTPIINPPQSAILGLHKIEERPVALDGQVVIRPMMYVALSYDHRLVDGRDAVQFLVTVKHLIEEPAALLLDT